MSIEQSCNECGAEEWEYLFDKDYPEHRPERDRTVQTVYKCDNCGAEGKHFEHKNGGPDTYTGAFR